MEVLFYGRALFVCFASKLSSSGCNRVGSLFTSKEQKKGGHVMQTHLPHIQLFRDDTGADHHSQNGITQGNETSVLNKLDHMSTSGLQ